MSNKEEGTANAYYQMAKKYEEEKREDKEQMILYYTRAAEQGHETAQYVLGLKYGFGSDVPKDLEKAIYWMSLSAEQEYDSKGEAHKALARLHAGKTPVGGCYGSHMRLRLLRLPRSMDASQIP